MKAAQRSTAFWTGQRLTWMACTINETNAIGIE
jgi:hypothetical protein